MQSRYGFGGGGRGIFQGTAQYPPADFKAITKDPKTVANNLAGILIKLKLTALQLGILVVSDNEILLASMFHTQALGPSHHVEQYGGYCPCATECAVH
jgi:hypothetical protein